MTITHTIAIALIITLTIPFVIYLIGLLLPDSHIVSRESTFKVSPKELWDILVDVSRYPEWQPKIEKVTIESIEAQKTNQPRQIVFIEYSTKKRHTVIVNHEAIENQRLIRILEERPVATPFGTSVKVPTFSGSWTFKITEDKEDSGKKVILKITEQGIIKKPLVRVIHFLFFGFHRRIDRFMDDLHKKINKENRFPDSALIADSDKTNDSKDVAKITNARNDLLDISEGSKGPIAEYQQEEKCGDIHNSLLASQYQAQESALSAKLGLLPHNERKMKNDAALIKPDVEIGTTADTSQSNFNETSDGLMTESGIATDKDWDLVSEIYEPIKAQESAINVR